MADEAIVAVAADVAEDTRFISRKFILTILVLILIGVLPLINKANGVSDTITIVQMVMLLGIGAAYGFMNIKDAKIELEKGAQELIGQGKIP